MALTNADIAAAFEQVGDLLEVRDANPVRVRAYRNAALAGQRIGYVTDTRYAEANCVQLDALLAGVDPLYIESLFLDEDAALTEHKNHLTARQAGTSALRVGARATVPFNFSPRYEDRSAELIAEVKVA